MKSLDVKTERSVAVLDLTHLTDCLCVLATEMTQREMTWTQLAFTRQQKKHTVHVCV